MKTTSVFVTGGSGYIGSRLIPMLLQRGHAVKALVRKGSEQKLPATCMYTFGDALNHETFVRDIAPADTLIHMVGVSHPGPSKAEQFRSVDLASIRASVTAATSSGIRHFIYISVAQPAPIMKAYVEARSEAEEMIRTSGLPATILRPWYVIGPGHYWPLLFTPLYWICEQLPWTSAGAQRLGLVALSQMIASLTFAVEHPSRACTIFDVPRIRTHSLDTLR